MSTSPADASRTGAASADHTIPARDVTPLLRILGDADAAVCVDGFCAVPASVAETTSVTRGADQ